MGPPLSGRAPLRLRLAAAGSVGLLVTVGAAVVGLLDGATLTLGGVPEAGGARPTVIAQGRAPFARPLTGPTRPVAAGGARFEVPRSREWSVAAPGTVVGVGRASGAVLRSPAYLRRGSCPTDRQWSNRGVIGVAVRSHRDPRRTIEAWREGLTGRAPRPGRGHVARVRLRGGTAARLARARFGLPPAVRRRTPCAPPAVVVSALRVRARGGAVTVVALSDAGVPGAFPAAVVDRILAGVRVAGAGPG